MTLWHGGVDLGIECNAMLHHNCDMKAQLLGLHASRNIKGGLGCMTVANARRSLEVFELCVAASTLCDMMIRLTKQECRPDSLQHPV